MLTGLLSGYRAFFALPDVSRLVAMAMLARMPLGMHGLALLLHVRSLTDSFATAGSAVGVYLAANAVTAPIVGRIVDRIGPRGPLLVMGTVCPIALTFVLAARPLGLAAPLILVFAAIGGAFAPPITVLTRTMWRYRFEHDHEARRTAFAVDAVLVELAFTLGPALIALVVGIANATVAYAVAIGFAALAVPVFLASPALAYWRIDPGVERHLLGPLTAPRLLLVYLVCALLLFCLGSLEVAYPGFATALGATALSGVLLAINSTGSAIGGLAYGGLRIAMPIERQLRILLVLLAASLAVQMFMTDPWLLAAMALLAGVFIAPSLTAVTLLVSANAPQRYATEAFTWAATCIVAGVGAGMAVGGQIVERSGAGSVFGVAAGAALVAAACALGLRAQPGRLEERG
jgi:MFS family permease